MKKLKGIAIIGLLAISWATNSQTSKYLEKIEDKNFKVMSYNIWNGFDWGKDVVRQKKMISWIKSKKPDVVALQELCAYTEEKLSNDARQWGHNYSILLKTDGYSVGLTSSKPIVLIEKVRGELWHGMLHAETWGVDFFVVHLSPADRDFRYKESMIISEKIKSIQNRNYIVLGDFNAHSPYDGDQDMLDDSHLIRVRESDAENEKHNNLMNEQFDYSVMSYFLSLPLIDVIQRFVPAKERFSFPTASLIDTWQTKESVIKNRVRIDYILVSRSMGMISTNAYIFNGEDTSMLSDHFPLMAEFELNN
jgi:exodeoxyribonuclease-3